jgi:hypothetical protein
VSRSGGGLCATARHRAYRLAGKFNDEAMLELDPARPTVHV